jgi:hypothetical protein
MDKKGLLKSKTFWFNIFMAVIPFFSNHVEKHAAAFGSVWAVLAIIVRLISKDKVVLIDG